MGFEDAVKVRPGDVFLTTLPGSLLSWMIIRMEKRRSKDKEARFSHAAFIDTNLKLYDIRWHVRHSELNEYDGRPCAIYRPIIDAHYLWEGLVRMKPYIGNPYPWKRLVLHRLGLADNIHWDDFVCSEGVVKMLHFAFRLARVFDFEKYFGKTPDWIDDYCRTHFESFKLVYEGTWWANGQPDEAIDRA